jgi:5-methyltetrahydropteroyltriglutamate--homocysteine methyltransferase|tara:strand:+ start:504 stop:1661 length:1158 start_codon:yes stop_codon:yes gene_type:complete
MQKSEDRILTTHAGSLPREPVLRELLKRKEKNPADVGPELSIETEKAVSNAIAEQVHAGIDIGNNGEQPRVGFSTYVTGRVKGFSGQSSRPTRLDNKDFPDFAEMGAERLRLASRVMINPAAREELTYDNLAECQEECEQFLRLARAADKKLSECFMTAASPGIVTTTMMNEYYDSHEKYLAAIAREMKKEYEVIHKQGLILQLDCPDLAMERSWFFQELTLPQFQERVQQHIQAINDAVTNIPPEQIRLHVCWGNSNSPHVNDVPLRDILPFLYEANVGALSLELANPRHQHEYKLFKQYPLPDSMVLIPGVIDSTVNYVEHPEVVTDRICQIVDAVGDRSRIIASTDCGFGTFAGLGSVATSVVWAKLKTLREGADMASRRLW